LAKFSDLSSGLSTLSVARRGRKTLHKQMRQAAKRLEFERAAELRDQIRDLERRMLGIIET
jgi:protein-arginine kinase activator protein McsA